MQIAVAYVATLVAILIVDLVWLGVVAKDFYRSELGHLMADQINWVAGVAFYLLFALGIVVFVIQPALVTGGPIRAFTVGLLFGLVAYATYDLTNLATMKSFPWKLALVDMAWGAVLTGTAAAIGTAVAARV